YVKINSPISTLIRCENHLFLAIAEVIDLTYQGKHVSELAVAMLTDKTTLVSYQLLYLVPTTSDDGPELKHDWKWSYKRGASHHRIPGRLVHPINPDISTSTRGKPFYVFESAILRALGMSTLDELPEDGQLLPEMVASPGFPYLHAGQACFVCEQDGKEREVIDAAMCTYCQPSVPLDKSAPRVLEHIGAHVLFDSNVDNDLEPCGLCLRPSPICTWYLRRSKGTGYQVDWKKSTCTNRIRFNYNVAAASSNTSPCSNIPIQCQHCPDKSPAVWSYNMVVHIKNKHPHVQPSSYKGAHETDEFEKGLMKNIWTNRHKRKEERKTQGGRRLVISEVHSSRLTLA
ncbi:uncharacterized protein EV420DRAFT_1705203, partial [Desarmillaria tabescens]